MLDFDLEDSHEKNHNNQKYNLIPEFYSTMGDIYRLLGVISLKDDYSDTADGRSKSQINTLTRISRSPGLDYDKKDKDYVEPMLADNDVENIGNL